MLRPVDRHSIAFLITPTEPQPDVTPTAPPHPASASSPSGSTAQEQAQAAAQRRLGRADQQARAQVDRIGHINLATIDPSIVDNIRSALAAEGIAPKDLNGHELYRRLLALNEERSEPWPAPALRAMAGIDSGNAAAIKRKGQPASPRTLEIQEEIKQNPTLNKAFSEANNASDRLRALLDSGMDLHKPSMARAAGVNPASMSRILQSRKALSDAASAIRLAVPPESQPLSYLKAIIAANFMRIDQGLTPWTDDDMISASGTRKDNAKRLLNRMRLAETTPEPSPGTEARSLSSAGSVKRGTPFDQVELAKKVRK